MTTESARALRNSAVTWAWILACCLFLLWFAGCAAAGSTLAGGAVGGAVAGPPGAAAGAAGGLIGFGWTSIVQWWHGAWDWLTGPSDPPPHIPTPMELFWWALQMALLVGAVLVILKLAGSRYRAMAWNAVKALFRLKPVVAVKSMLAAEGVIHSGDIPIVQPRKTQDIVLDSVLPKPPEGDT